jgi:molybdate transport system substrate-binding protein
VTDVPPGVTVFCDPPLRPAMLALGPLAGAPVAVLCAPAPSMLAQIQRHTRNDVLFTLSSSMDQAVQQGLVRPETRVDGYSNRLVFAALVGRFPAAFKWPGLVTVAVTDNTVVSGLDGLGILAANGRSPSRVVGAASTADVAFLVTTGAADIGLIYATDAAADPRLAVLSYPTAAPAVTSLSAAINAAAVSPNAQAFLSVVRSAAGAAALRNAGLEMAA